MKIENKSIKYYKKQLYYKYIYYFRIKLPCYINQLIYFFIDLFKKDIPTLTEEDFRQCEWNEEENYLLIWQKYLKGNKKEYLKKINNEGPIKNINDFGDKFISILFVNNNTKRINLEFYKDKLILDIEPFNNIFENLKEINNFNGLNILYFFMHISAMQPDISKNQKGYFLIKTRGIKLYFNCNFIPGKDKYVFNLELIKKVEELKPYYDKEKSKEKSKEKYNKIYKETLKKYYADSIKLGITEQDLEKIIEEKNLLIKLTSKEFPSSKKNIIEALILPNDFDYDYISIYDIYFYGPYNRKINKSKVYILIFYKDNKINRVLFISTDGFIEYEKTMDGEKSKLHFENNFKEAIRYIDESKK